MKKMKWLYFGQQGKSRKPKSDNDAYFFYGYFKTPWTQVISSTIVLCYPSVFHLIYQGICATSTPLLLTKPSKHLIFFKMLLLKGLFLACGLFWFVFFLLLFLKLNSLPFPNVIFLIYMKVRKKMRILDLPFKVTHVKGNTAVGRILNEKNFYFIAKINYNSSHCREPFCNWHKTI